MKEIDLLLVAWLDHSYRAASSTQQRAFREFLELPDPEIAGYLLGREFPAETAQRELVAALLQARAHSLPSHRP